MPKNPRASTRELAVVGVGGTPRATNERVRPWRFSVATRGGDMHGNGTDGPDEVSISVAGVRVEALLGDGGKTKSVCDGPDEGGGGRCIGIIVFESVRSMSGGNGGREDCVRVRRGTAPSTGAGAGLGLGVDSIEGDCTGTGSSFPMVTGTLGDAGTGGRRLTKGAGRRFGFGVV
jgi:hypothetical protein